MAESRQDLLSKLADRGEDVVGKLAEIPAAQRLVDAGMQLKDRVDELQKRVRGLDALERRVAVLEKKVDELSRPAKAAPKRATTRRTTQAKKTTQ